MKMSFKISKRILGLVLVLVMIVSILPTTAYAVVSDDGWYINDNILFVTGKLTGLPQYSYRSINVVPGGELALAEGVVCQYEVANNGVISSGTFQGAVTNIGTISDGTFRGKVENRHTISGGAFWADVQNNGKIAGGTFYRAVENVASGSITEGGFQSAVVNYGSISGGGFWGDVKNEHPGIISGGAFWFIVTNNSNISDGTFHSLVTNNGLIRGGTFQSGVTNNETATIKGGTFAFNVANDGQIVEAKFLCESIMGNKPQSVIHSVNGEDKPLAYGEDLLDALGETQEGTAWYAGDTCVSGGTVPLHYTAYTSKAHSHSYAYMGNGNTITETCLNGCGHSLTAKLQVKEGTDLTYTGSAIEPMEILYPAGWQGAQIQPTSASYTNNKNVGTAICTIVYTGGATVTNSFEIATADQSAPAGITAIDETISKKADGKITNVDTTMEYRKDGATSYTAITGNTVENLAAGKYYVRVKGDGNHNPSADVAVTIAAGRKLTVTLPQNCVGYTVTTTVDEVDYGGNVTFTLTVHEGYSKTDSFKFICNNVDRTAQLVDGKTYSLSGLSADVTITVEGIADTTAPSAEIDVKGNKWTEFWNNLTFGLFFKETQDVTITATDAVTGIKSIEYYLASGELELDEVRAVTDWEDYNGTFQVNPNNHYVVYAKVTDNAGNTLIINSDGITLDNVAPALEGIEDGKTYYGDLTVIKSGEQFYDIKVVMLDGEAMSFLEGTYGLIPADNAEHTVVVEDHAGNKTTYTVTVMKNYTVTYKADGVTIDTQTVGHGKDAVAPAIPVKEGYTQTAPTWDKDGKNVTVDTEIHAVYTANEYTITFMAENGVYKTLTCKHGETVTMPDVPTKEGYTVKWDTTIDKATGDVTIRAVYTEIPKTDTPSSPQTGDNSNLWLWFTLLFVSAAGIFGITMNDLKRRATGKNK